MNTAREAKVFKVALCGFSNSEHNVVGRAFKLSSVRPRQYLRWADGEARAPDLYLVNDDLSDGPERWRGLASAHAQLPAAPVLRIGSDDGAQDGFYEDAVADFCRRPLIASRLLTALDKLVVRFFHYTPELVIGDANSSSEAIADIEQVSSTAAQGDEAKRILVVDDSAAVRQLMDVKLSMEGHRVEFAHTGEEALRCVRKFTYDLIFLDVMLPGINGYEVCRVLKRELKSPTPVVILTSKSSRIDRLRGSLASADGYLIKPLPAGELDTVLKRFIGS